MAIETGLDHSQGPRIPKIETKEADRLLAQREGEKFQVATARALAFRAFAEFRDGLDKSGLPEEVWQDDYNKIGEKFEKLTTLLDAVRMGGIMDGARIVDKGLLKEFGRELKEAVIRIQKSVKIPPGMVDMSSSEWTDFVETNEDAPVSEVTHVDNATTMKGEMPKFSDVLKKETGKVVILYIGADYCAPCKKLGPFYHELAAEGMGEDVVFTKHYEGKQYSTGVPSLVQQYKVGGLPQVLIFRDGQEVARLDESDLIDDNAMAERGDKSYVDPTAFRKKFREGLVPQIKKQQALLPKKKAKTR